MKKTILAALAMMLITFTGNAQAPDYIYDGALIDGKTIVKADLMGLGLRNIGFSAERIFSEKFSINLGVRFMPEGGIPALSLVERQLEKKFASSNGFILTNTKFNSFAFTPELRIYLDNQGYGRGFYIAPYYNYFAFNLSDLKYEIDDNGKMEYAIFDGGIKTHSGGLMIGHQWLVGANKNIVIDWGIIGAHIGKSAGQLNGTGSRPITAEEQADAKAATDEILSKIRFFKFTTTVTENSGKIDEKGPWAFLRTHISIGFRF